MLSVVSLYIAIKTNDSNFIARIILKEGFVIRLPASYPMIVSSASYSSEGTIYIDIQNRNMTFTILLEIELTLLWK
jgi:uncharacterized membrane protein YjjB (DUF3815 family)